MIKKKRDSNREYFKKLYETPEGKAFLETPQGKASVETYTVVHSREGPNKGIIIGRLEDGTRFLANTEKDSSVLDYMCNNDILKTTGVVSTDGKRNIFKPNQ